MRIAILPVAAGAVLSLAATAWGQATTVQLPTYSFFTVKTTVSVPDSGGAYLGGINRARDSSTTRGFGPLANRGVGMDRVASGMSVHATIIDHKELDERLLAEAAAKRGPVDPTAAKAELLSAHVGATAGLPSSAAAGDTAGRASSGTPFESVAAILRPECCCGRNPLVRIGRVFRQGPASRSREQARGRQDLLSDGRAAGWGRAQAACPGAVGGAGWEDECGGESVSRGGWYRGSVLGTKYFLKPAGTRTGTKFGPGY